MSLPTQPTGNSQSPIALDDFEFADLPPLALRYVSGECEIDHNGYSIHVHPTTRCELQIADEVLVLKQFHFHTPSEHTLQGEQFPLVIHFVHQDATHGLTVLCVFAREGASNAGLEMLTEAVPLDHSAPNERAVVDPALLVPALDDYLHYDGSLTTPPYSEGVRWIVLTEPITVSADQIARFADTTPHNARDLQPRSGRRVQRRRR